MKSAIASRQVAAGGPPIFGDTPSRVRRILDHEISSAAIFSGLIFWFGLSQLLLWRFLGAFSAPVFLAAAMLLVGLSRLVHQSVTACDQRGSSVRQLFVCFFIALALFALGGQGGFFYANIDWQVRDAVFRDISTNPWPFAYTAREEPDILRGAIGMYLAPALFYKGFGPATGDFVLLIQNSLLLAFILALGSSLFADRRAKLIALSVFLAFSGLDIIGQLFVERRLVEHLEWWSGLQYSSHVTLAFWTPHYAIAGWLLAAAFMLHQQGRAPIGVFYALAPLTALWSPLTMLGVIPFAAIAGFASLARRTLRFGDAAVAGVAIVMSAPTLLYLGAAQSAVGARYYPIKPIIYLLFQIVETLPFLVPLAFLYRTRRFGTCTFAAICLFLLAAPFLQIGYSTDFMMRATIPAFAILAVMTADALIELKPATRPWRVFLLCVLTIGSATGLFEIRRAFVDPPAPRGECTFFKAWDQSFSSYPKDSHLSPIADIPPLIRPRSPAIVSPVEPARCWEGEWRRPSGV